MCLLLPGQVCLNFEPRPAPLPQVRLVEHLHVPSSAESSGEEGEPFVNAQEYLRKGSAQENLRKGVMGAKPKKSAKLQKERA